MESPIHSFRDMNLVLLAHIRIASSKLKKKKLAKEKSPFFVTFILSEVNF